jgi:diphthamide synthase (EF-2-diphthine--ammonia ligase)
MDILFWSGGKDAYLALHFYRQEYPDTDLRLLTTYEKATGDVPHQQIEMSHIHKQAEDLGLPLITIPLPTDCPNDIYLKEIEQKLSGQNESIRYLIFGDWHLQDIRQWREEVFKNMGYKCLFPIWKKSIHDLLPVLQFQPVKVEINAVQEKYKHLIRVGETYNQSFVVQLRHLPEEIDPMGENGEFHTKVIFKDLGDVSNAQYLPTQ